MKHFYILIFAFILNVTKAQYTAGVTTYTHPSNFLESSIYLPKKFNADINSLGEVFFTCYNYTNGKVDLCKYLNGVFTSFSSSIIANYQNARLFTINNDVWIIDNNSLNPIASICKFNGSSFTDFTSTITAATGITKYNCVSKQNADILVGTNNGIIKISPSTITVLNTSNSSLINDTINDLKSISYTSVLIGTQNGLTTYNGSGFSPAINFPTSSNNKVGQIYMSPTRTIVTKSTGLTNDFYELLGGALSLMNFQVAPNTYNSNTANHLCLDNNDFYTKILNMNLVQKVVASTVVKSYFIDNSNGNNSAIFKSPVANKIIKITPKASSIVVNFQEIDLSNYASLDTYDPNLHRKYLDTNYVHTPMLTNNRKHYDIFYNGYGEYKVPFINGVSTPSNTPTASYASNLWIGGFDALGSLHLAAQCYYGETDFWSGPLDTTNATTSISKAAPYNQVLKFSCNQINSFVNNINIGNTSALSSPSYSSIMNYLPNGNSTNNFTKQIAPYKDWNNNGIYEPNNGDYPLIKGHQQLTTIYNDAFSAHTTTSAQALGIEVVENLYAYNSPTLPDSMQVINYTTFNNYKIINRSNNNYNNVLLTIWNDVDIGYYLNDYIGSDTLLNFAYAYDADTNDVGCYGKKLPMMGYTFLNNNFSQSDGIDNDNDGTIDEPNEQFNMSKITYYYNNIGVVSPATTQPSTAINYYKYMNAMWQDGNNFTFGGTAYNPSSTNAIKKVFPGDIATNTGWTEKTANNIKGDRRVLCTVGPFNFPAKKTIEIDFATIFSRDTSLNYVNNNLNLLKKDIKNVRYYHNNANNCLPTVNVGVEEKNFATFELWSYPNPATNYIVINSTKNLNKPRYTIYNAIGMQVKSGKFDNPTTSTIDVSNLSQGIYFVEVIDGSFKAVHKLIKD